MRWREARSALQKKLGASHQKGTKHDFWHVKCGDKYVGAVKDSHGDGEMHSHEIGGSARSLGASEYDFKQLVACPLSGEDFCAKYHAAK
jgi:hypothetical protein